MNNDFLSYWQACTPAPVAHPILQAKNIDAHDARVNDNGDLVIPVFNADFKPFNALILGDVASNGHFFDDAVPNQLTFSKIGEHLGHGDSPLIVGSWIDAAIAVKGGEPLVFALNGLFSYEDKLRKLLNEKYGYLPRTAPITPNGFNAVLDTERRYSKVNIVRHIPDNHLLSRFSRHVAENSQLPLSTVALMGMTVFSSMLMRRYVVVYPDGSPLPIGLYAVAEQPSGTGKSRCLRAFQAPFYKIYSDIIKRLKTEIKRLKSDIEKAGITDEEISNIKKDIEAACSKLAHIEKAPLFVTNATPEGLECTLSDSEGFFAAVSSEQGLSNSLFGVLYNNSNKPNNNDIVLNGFDGGFVSVARAKRSAYTGAVCGAIATFAQSGSIETILNQSNGTGLSERFLMLAEPHRLGKRDHTKIPACNEKLDDEYSKACGLVADVLETPVEYEELKRLFIDNEGWMMIRKLQNEIEPHLADGGKYGHTSLRGAASKIDMQVMKVAAVLELMGSTDTVNNRISNESVKAAIGICRELLENALTLCSVKGLIGAKAEYTAILKMQGFEQGKPLSERQIIQSRSVVTPFSQHTGNKSQLIKDTLADMVRDGVLAIYPDSESGKLRYRLAQ